MTVDGAQVDAQWVWMNGTIVPAAEACIPVLSHGLHYGTGVFEGIRVYETARGPAAFRLTEHLDRLLRSARMYYIDVPYGREDLRAAVHELVDRTGLTACYVRPLVFCGTGTMSVDPREASVEVVIAAWPWGPYLGEGAAARGIRATVSSWRRMSGDALVPMAKASGQYLNSVLAKLEAERAGYDEAILLDHRGMVSEGSGENIFLVMDGVVLTPGLASSILPGVTRASVIELAREGGYEVIERDIDRHELQIADELFVTGTATELVPVSELDGVGVGDGLPGPVTQELRQALTAVLTGRDDRYQAWSEPIGQAYGLKP